MTSPNDAVEAVENRAVQLHRDDAVRAEGQRRQHVAPTARADDVHAAAVNQVEPDVDDVVAQMLDVIEVAVEGGQDGLGRRVDVQVQLPQPATRS